MKEDKVNVNRGLRNDSGRGWKKSTRMAWSVLTFMF